MPSIRIMLAHFNTTTMALYLRVANCQSVPFQISTTSRTKRNPNDDEPDPDGMDSLRDPDENVSRGSPPFAPVYLMGIYVHTYGPHTVVSSARIQRRAVSLNLREKFRGSYDLTVALPSDAEQEACKVTGIRRITR